MTNNAHQADLELLIKAARSAGEIAKQHYEQGESKVWNKAQDHPVTDADIAVNDHLAEVLKSARPSYGWLSEETKDDFSRRTREYCFVIDPIDGTRAFIDRLPHFTICLAVLRNGICVAGVVYNPLTAEMFEAVLGGGARLNHTPLTANACDDITNCSMIGYPRKFKKLGWPAMDICIRNSMAYRIVLVAAGLKDATVAFTPKSDWDLAAASLIASEAGAVITDIEGKPFNFAKDSTSNAGVICASPSLHALLLDKINSASVGETTHLETRMSDRNHEKNASKQLLHIVIGGELIDPMKTEFIDLEKVVYVGAYPNYKKAYESWKNAAQSTVDNAHMRFFILHAHELIDPDNDGIIG